MFFEDDVKLFGLMRRYSDEYEIEELKNQVVQYVKTQIHDVPAEIQEFQTANTMQEPGAEQVFEVSETHCMNNRWQIYPVVRTWRATWRCTIN
jgi:hypothetical protein